MVRMTPEEVSAIFAARKDWKKGADETPDEGPEARLQSKIVAWAAARGYPCLSFRQSRKAAGFITPGWPDVTLILPNGRVSFVELKAAKGVLSEDQKLMRSMFAFLGHEYHQVRSFKRFLEVVE